jgi:hypothetical protein
MAMNFLVPLNVRQCFNILTSRGFSSRTKLRGVRYLVNEYS